MFWGGGLVVVVVLAVLLSAGTNEEPLDPRSVAPDGAKALVDLLASFGADVELGVNLPDATHQVAVLLDDTYGQADRTRAESWVRGGGILVAADPGSPLTPAVTGTFDADGDPDGAPPCEIDVLAQVEAIAGAEVRYAVRDFSTGCFADAVVLRQVGEGAIVSVGGPGPFLNDRLSRDSNAVLAVSLMAPNSATRVAFLEPALPTGVGGETLVDLIGDGVWVMLAQAGVGFAIFAWWRGRRLGAPVREPLPVVISGSELTAARGRLLEGTGHSDAAAADIRAGATARLARITGLPASSAAAAVAAAVGAATDVHTDDVIELLETRPVTNDADLLDLSRDLVSLCDRLSAPEPAHLPTAPGAP